MIPGKFPSNCFSFYLLQKYFFTNSYSNLPVVLVSFNFSISNDLLSNSLGDLNFPIIKINCLLIEWGRGKCDFYKKHSSAVYKNLLWDLWSVVYTKERRLKNKKEM